MALPNLSHADLEKLKLFINFVSSNPTVLNLPQLEFVKEFIEKFGGKVPVGEFKMPGGGGGKCPFGGDAAGAGDDGGADIGGMKTETNIEEEAEEDSEPESEVELDMEVETLSEHNEASTQYYNASMSDTNAVYFEESKFVKKRHKKAKLEQSQSPFGEEPYEMHVEALYERDQMGSDNADPIETTPKHEDDSDFVWSDDNREVITSEADQNTNEDDDNLLMRIVKKSAKCKSTKRNTSNSNKSKAKQKKTKRSSKRKAVVSDVDYTYNNDYEYSDEGTDDEEDEPLSKCKYKKKEKASARAGTRRIVTRRSGGTLVEPPAAGRKRIKRPRPINCPSNCRYNCREKLDNERREELCRQLWQMDFVERKNYLLKLIERRPLGRMRLCGAAIKPPRSFTKNYYLYARDGERVRVCVGFFQSTLCISSGMLKETIQKSDGQGHYLGIDKRGGSGAGRRSNLAELERANIAAMRSVLNIDQATTQQQQDNIPIGTAGPIRVAPFPRGLPLPPEAQEIVKNLPPPKKQNDYKNRKPRIKVRAPQPVKCAEQCQWKCASKFSEEQRAQICASFWSLDYKRRKDYVLSRIETRSVLSMTALEYRKTNRAARSYTNRYFFRSATGENVRVCAFFFLGTLCIGRHFVDHAQRHADLQTGTYAGEDRRGRHPPKNKMPDSIIEEIKRHIGSYPTWVPHKNHKTRFLHSALSIRKMYNEYKKTCDDEQRKGASFTFFSKIFHKEFKLAFLQPTSKHANKVSPHKKDIKSDSKLLRLYANISDYTGEEGGFWMNPNGTMEPTGVPQANEAVKDKKNTHPSSTTSVIVAPSAVPQQCITSRTTMQHDAEIQTHPPVYLQPAPQIQSVSHAFFANAASYLSQQHMSGVGYGDQTYSNNLQLL